MRPKESGFWDWASKANCRLKSRKKRNLAARTNGMRPFIKLVCIDLPETCMNSRISGNFFPLARISLMSYFIKTVLIKGFQATWISFFFFTVLTSEGQTIDVNTANATFRENSIKGFVVCLELDVKSVESAWRRYLRSLGKFESIESQSMAGMNLMLSNVSNDAIDFYSRLTVSPRCIQIYMSATRAGSYMELTDEQKESVRKMLYNFALSQYREDLIRQITEAERVVNLAVKAHDKRIDEGQNLKSKLNRNRKEKVKLLKDLDDNGKNLVRLKADSVQNASEQETALEEISKVRKIAEEKKQKLSQVK
jgi:hypothetical protein